MKFNLKSKKTWVIISVIGALSVGGFFLLNKNKDISDAPTEETYVEMYSIPGAESVYINGKITPKKSKSFIKDPTLGEISNVKVSSGEVVDKGDVLYTYKNKAKEEEVKTDSSDLKTMESDLATLKKNPEENIMEIRTLEKEIKALKSKISQAKSEINTSITAPFSGIVYLEKESDNETETKPFLTLQSRDFYVEGTVTERELLKLKVGMSADIHIFSSEEDKAGTVTGISKRPTESAPDSMGMASNLSSYPVTLEFESNDGLVNGFNVQAKINLSEVKIEVPSSAVFTEGENQYVLVDKEGIATKQLITTESHEGSEMVTVLSGLEAEDAVVKDVQLSGLKDGESIYPCEDQVEGETTSSGGVTIG